MRRRHLAAPGPVALALLALATAAGTALADEIILIPNATLKVPGGRIRGLITSETPAEVKIKPATGADQSVAIDQIASISYDGAPPTYSLAESSENKGALDDAARLYKQAASEAASKPLIAQAAQARRVEILADAALAAPNKANEAIAELDDFVRKYPTGRHIGAALESLVRLQLQKADTAKADAALAQLEKVPGAGDRAAVLRARVLGKAGKNDQAVASLDRIIASGKGPAQVREAKLAKAECLVAMSKYDDALAAVQEVIKEAPPEAVDIQAVAHNTLGDCYRAARRPKDALLAYLQTDVLYDKDKEQHPRALANIEQLFRDIKQDGRADEVRERLKQLYPQSPWAAGAKK